MITEKKIKEIVDKIISNYQPEKIILFGSYANGNPDMNSDLDLFIIKNTKTPKQKRGRELRKYLYGSLVPMDLKIYTPQEFNDELTNRYSFLFSAIKGSKTLYERKN
ncbi:MAG: nucleotidyltransferase domain-containing protein [Bacteroidetes bacterium]|nr:nucleotidyltransferase domain-containing protein [Bacteroidota bacterium]MBL7103322.1 nucleotidyltransferase domain-containing protein [Bacteroidales bacterium]